MHDAGAPSDPIEEEAMYPAIVTTKSVAFRPVGFARTRRARLGRTRRG